MTRLREEVGELVRQQYELLNKVMFPEMNEAGMRFVQSHEWNDEQTGLAQPVLR